MPSHTTQEGGHKTSFIDKILHPHIGKGHSEDKVAKEGGHDAGFNQQGTGGDAPLPQEGAGMSSTGAAGFNQPTASGFNDPISGQNDASNVVPAEGARGI